MGGIPDGGEAMTAKEQLLKEIEQLPDSLVEATLQFLRNAKADLNGVPSPTCAPAQPAAALLANLAALPLEGDSDAFSGQT